MIGGGAPYRRPEVRPYGTAGDSPYRLSKNFENLPRLRTCHFPLGLVQPRVVPENRMVEGTHRRKPIEQFIYKSISIER